jgi:putative transposase
MNPGLAFRRTVGTVARMACGLLLRLHMPRLRRSWLVEAGSTNHCTWRSHNRTLVLDTDEARSKFLDLLAKYKDRYGIQIHSYCLMGTHPHVVLSASNGQEDFSRFWKVVNQCFARWSNRRTQGRGQVVMERLRSPRIRAGGSHQLTVMRYGDMNPVRAGLVRRPKDWAWSSHRHYAFGERSTLITDAPEYLSLGRTGPERRKAYVHLFARGLVEPLARHRPDLVVAPFIGDEVWVARRLVYFGLSPPR